MNRNEKIVRALGYKSHNICDYPAFIGTEWRYEGCPYSQVIQIEKDGSGWPDFRNVKWNNIIQEGVKNLWIKEGMRIKVEYSIDWMKIELMSSSKILIIKEGIEEEVWEEILIWIFENLDKLK